MTYLEQIRNPKWQKKRLEIMQRDGFKCCICKANDKPLNVHHLYYMPKTLIWEYDNEAMKTVCEEHHEQLTKDLPKLAGLLAFDILRKKYIIP